MALARCGVIILLLPVIALTSASKASAKGRHVVTEATSLSESIMALDELVQGSVLRSIRSFERIIKEEFDYLGNLDVAKTIHVKDKNGKEFFSTPPLFIMINNRGIHTYNIAWNKSIP